MLVVPPLVPPVPVDGKVLPGVVDVDGGMPPGVVVSIGFDGRPVDVAEPALLLPRLLVPVDVAPPLVLLGSEPGMVPVLVPWPPTPFAIEPEPALPAPAPAPALCAQAAAGRASGAAMTNVRISFEIFILQEHCNVRSK